MRSVMNGRHRYPWDSSAWKPRIAAVPSAVCVHVRRQDYLTVPTFGFVGREYYQRAAMTMADHVADAQLGHACQGAVWSDDQKRLLVQCSVERDIRVFDFDGKALTERPEAVLQMVSRPGAMVTSKTR